MDIHGTIIRENGQWKIKLFLEQWVLDDIKLDGGKPLTTVIILHNAIPTSTRWQSNEDRWFGALLAAVIFDEVMDKKE